MSLIRTEKMKKKIVGEGVVEEGNEFATYENKCKKCGNCGSLERIGRKVS